MPQEKLSKILVNTIKIGVLAVLFLPLVLSSQFFFPFVVLRNFLFRVIVEFIFVLYIILAIQQPHYRPNFKNKLSLAVIIFFIVLFFSSLFGVDFRNSIWGNYERMNGLFHSLHLVIYFFVLVGVFKNKKDWLQFFTFSIFVSLIMSFIGLAQYYQAPFLLKSSGGLRLTGTVGNAIYLAAYFIFNLFLIYYFFLKEQSFSLKFFIYSLLSFDIILIIYEIYLRVFTESSGVLAQIFEYPKVIWPILILQIFVFSLPFIKFKQKVFLRIFLVLVFIFEFFIFFNTQTRGAVLGLLAGVLFFVLLKIIFGQKKEKIYASLLIFLILASGLLVYANKESEWVKSVPTIYRMTTISPKSITGESRLLTWGASWKGMIERPILGYGPENYNIIFNKYFPTEIFRDAGSQIWFDKAHNIIFDIGVTSGFIGLLSYLSIFVFAFYCLIKNFKNNKNLNESMLMGAILISYLVQNLFVFDTLNTEILFYLILGFIVFQSEINIPIKEETRKEIEFNFFIPVVLSIIFLFSFYNFNYKTIKGNRILVKALYAKAGKIQAGESIYSDQIFDDFKKALFYNQATIGRFETRQQLASYAMDLVKDEKADQKKVKIVIDFAVKEMEKSIEESPFNVREYLYSATLYNTAAKFNLNYLNKSINLLTKAIELSPSRPQLYFERGQAKIFMGQSEDAIKDFKKGVELAPWVIDSHWNLAAAYILADKEEEAEKELAISKDLGFNLDTVENYQKLIQVYTNKQNYLKIAELYEKIIKLEPNNFSHYAKMAWAYMAIGDKEKAREATQRAVELNPSLKEQADLFLEELDKK